ncbi:hypothetical protein GW932_00330 [archaeon]|nr:hypothetical protein [archaeon]
MTTGISLHAYDKDFKKEYILLASDSQRSTQLNNMILAKSYDAKKILYNEKSNFFISHSGRQLTNSMNNSINTIINYDQLIYESNLSKGMIFDILDKFEEPFYSNHYHFAINEKGKLSLNARAIPENFCNPKIIEKNIFCSWIGTGGEFIQEFILDEVLKSKKNENGFLEIPLKHSLDFFYSSLCNASKKDQYTGGNMQIGVLEKNNSSLIYDFAPLEIKEDFYTIENRNLESLRKENINLSKSLDKILLGI